MINKVSNTLNPEILVKAEFMWFILLFVILIFLITYYIFSYHWNSFGIEKNRRVFARPLFWIISVILILAMTFSVLAFEYL